jgi:signal transduction histidine kinase
LSICKSIIEKMGGSVTVKSELGEGSTFIMNFRAMCREKVKWASNSSLVKLSLEK